MNSQVKKISTVSILSGLGMVLMLIEIPYFIPGLNFDISDVVVMIALMMFGWKEAVMVGFVKALLHALLKPAFGPVYIGEITAFIASSMIVVGMWLAINKFKFNKIVTVIFTVAVVTITLTVLNYIVITPLWIVYLATFTPSFATFADMSQYNVAEVFGMNGNLSYGATVVLLFGPFNIMKVSILFVLYYIIEKPINSYLTFTK